MQAFHLILDREVETGRWSRTGVGDNLLHPSKGRDHIGKPRCGQSQHDHVQNFFPACAGIQGFAGGGHHTPPGTDAQGDTQLGKILGLFVQGAGSPTGYPEFFEVL